MTTRVLLGTLALGLRPHTLALGLRPHTLALGLSPHTLALGLRPHRAAATVILTRGKAGAKTMNKSSFAYGCFEFLQTICFLLFC